MLGKGMLAAIALSLWLPPALAAPAELLNKTIRISYTSSMPAVDGLSYPPRSNLLTMYVSSRGRVFMRRAVRAGRYGEGGDSVAGNFRFVGSKMIGIRRFGNGAVQITISFDKAFQSCSFEFTVGTERGKRLEWVSLNGIRRTASGHATFSSQTCAIENGNAFAP